MTSANGSRRPLPVLTEDDSRFDWRTARYRPEVRVKPTRAVIQHRLESAPTLEALLADGRVAWATEVRCPKTLLGRIELASGGEQVVTWKPQDVDESMYVIPGLLATADFELHPQPGDLNSLWDDGGLEVNRGRWLALGTARRTQSLGQSLLVFHKDEKLANGRMRIGSEQVDADLRFHVYLAEDIWGERQHRHVQMAALIGAFGHMSRIASASGGDDAEEPHVMGEIRQRLDDEGVKTWRDGEHFDPALAATVIEPFLATGTPGAPDDSE